MQPNWKPRHRFKSGGFMEALITGKEKSHLPFCSCFSKIACLFLGIYVSVESLRTFFLIIEKEINKTKISTCDV
jgi:hypothetical protein